MEYFKLNQTVYHPIYGEGKVITIIENGNYPIRVKFKEFNTCFTKDGRSIKPDPVSLSQTPIPKIVNKPLEPEYEPFTYQEREFLRNKWIKHNKLEEECFIHTIDEKGVIIGTDSVYYHELLLHYKFLDGTPCGKKE